MNSSREVLIKTIIGAALLGVLLIMLLRHFLLQS
jgi:hypothetical protein